jgi:hypothetical protein
VADIREILTEWTLPSGSGHLTVMYFPTGPTIADQRTALHTFWTAVKAVQATGAVYNIQTVGRVLDDATGTLTGSWSEASVKNGAGGAGAASVPDAAQALVQWRCGTIVNGRFVRGRTFIPALGQAQTSNGNLAPGAKTVILNAAAALAASASGISVWHRPIAGSGGSIHAPGSVTVWDEFATLRRRRG